MVLFTNTALDDAFVAHAFELGNGIIFFAVCIFFVCDELLQNVGLVLKTRPAM